MSRQQPTICWPDGNVQHAPTWGALLTEVHRLPWNRHLKPDEFRNELARRAYVWCGEPLVHPEAQPHVLFRQLESAHMLRIVHGKADLEKLVFPSKLKRGW